MIASVRQRGHAPKDDNRADALALLHWAVQTPEVWMKIPTFLPLPLGSPCSLSRPTSGFEATWLARPAHPRGQQVRRAAGLR